MNFTLNLLNGSLRECGCCPAPECCPPKIECRSIGGVARFRGFLRDPGSDSDSSEFLPLHPTFWLRKVITETNLPGPDEMAVYGPAGAGAGDPYVSVRYAGGILRDFIESYSAAWEADFGTVDGDCPFTPRAVYELSCEGGGSWTRETFRPYREDVTGGESIGAWANFRDSLESHTITECSGEETQQHIDWVADAAAWDADHPDYPAELAAWQADHDAWDAEVAAYEVANDAWMIEYAAWQAGGEVGPEPEQPDDVRPQPERPPERPEEPAEFYPPCTFKEVWSSQNYRRVNPGGGWVIEEDGPAMNGVIIPAQAISGTGTTVETTAPDYEDPVTWDEAAAAADAWLIENLPFDHADASDSVTCEFGEQCGAVRVTVAEPEIPLYGFNHRFFQYRIKLNKCCGWREIHSGWLTVHYTAEWLAWRAYMDAKGESESDEPEPDPPPYKVPQAWTWVGIPPLCPEGSASDSSSMETDPFDHEPMWSPWSLPIAVPGTEDGTVVNRNYQQKCYEASPQTMDGVFGVDPDDESEPI